MSTGSTFLIIIRIHNVMLIHRRCHYGNKTLLGYQYFMTMGATNFYIAMTLDEAAPRHQTSYP